MVDLEEFQKFRRDTILIGFSYGAAFALFLAGIIVVFYNVVIVEEMAKRGIPFLFGLMAVLIWMFGPMSIRTKSYRQRLRRFTETSPEIKIESEE